MEILDADEFEELRRELAIGIEQLERGESAEWDAADLKARLREYILRKPDTDGTGRPLGSD